MTRKQKLMLNSGMGMLKQFVAMICSFILPRYILAHFGSEVNGLVYSISHFLSFISLLEMGIGPVIQANLYKPLADKDNTQLSKIIVSSERFFRKIAYIFIAYIVVLAVVYPTFIDASFDAIFTISLLVLVSLSMLAEYFFGVTYLILLNADQKSYISQTLYMVTLVINTVVCIILMENDASIITVKAVSALIFILKPVFLSIIVKKHYSLNKKIVLTSEPIKQKWNGFVQHITTVVCNNTGAVVLSLFASLSSVSVYSVYFAVVNGISSVVMTAATGLESFFGNILAKNEKEALGKSFSTIELLIHFLVSILFTITVITLVPFVGVYTRGIEDVDYFAPIFALFLTLASALQCLRIPYFRLIKAAGHFKETQNGTILSAVINIVVSVALFFKFGLVGIGIGSLASYFYQTCYYAWYLRKNIVNISIWRFVCYIFADFAVGIIAYFLTKGISAGDATYFSWIIYAIKISIVSVISAVLVYLLLYGKRILKLLKNN